MRPAALALLGVLVLGGCGGDAPAAAPTATGDAASPSATGFSEDVRSNFLDSCLDNAKNTAQGAASDAQLSATCTCILGKVEAEYSQAEFADFERRLVDGSASEQESQRLTTWSTDCAEEATSG